MPRAGASGGALVGRPKDSRALDPPVDPSFSLRGRTPRSLFRLIDAWNESMGNTDDVALYRFSPSGYDSMVYEMPDSEGRAVHWSVVELSTRAGLRAEGHRLRHCVALYDWICRRGQRAIWSLRRSEPGHVMESRATIEIDPRERQVRQVKGYRNRSVVGLPRELIHRWADHNGLGIAPYVWG